MWLFFACAHSGGLDAGAYRDAVGTVHAVAETWAVEPDADDSQRFCLTGPLVTEGMRVEGARVEFSGTPLEVAANERRACLPFEFTALALAP